MRRDSPPPTTRQIAQAAGVSHVTVSRALRNHPFVHPATRQRVLDAAQALGYRPNPLLEVLMHQMRSRHPEKFVATLGWINTHPEEKEWHKRPWRRKVFYGAEKRARQLGYRLDEFWTAEPGMTPTRLAHILHSRKICGLIIPPSADDDFLGKLDCSKLAIAVIGPPALKEEVSFIDADTGAGMISAIKALQAAGYRRPGLALAPTQDPPGHPWRATFLSLQADWEENARVPPLRLQGTLGDCRREYAAWLKKQKPDVVIGCDALLKPFAEAAGFSVPDDLGIVHLHLADDVKGWSGIDTGDECAGSTAVDVVAAAIQRNELGPPLFPKRILVPPRWIAGNTTRR